MERMRNEIGASAWCGAPRVIACFQGWCARASEVLSVVAGRHVCRGRERRLALREGAS